jgi:hypothetical protein
MIEFIFYTKYQKLHLVFGTGTSTINQLGMDELNLQQLDIADNEYITDVP